MMHTVRWWIEQHGAKRLGLWECIPCVRALPLSLTHAATYICVYYIFPSKSYLIASPTVEYRTVAGVSGPLVVVELVKVCGLLLRL